jgi:hypothetical protein
VLRLFEKDLIMRICALLSALCLVLPLAAQAAQPTGIYALYRAGVPIGPLAAGATVSAPWSTIEPSAGVYDWSTIDAGLAAAGTRPVQIEVVPGAFTPGWVYAEGVPSMSLTWDWNYAYPMCSTQRLPVPWSATYLSDWTRLVTAMSQRYATNAQVLAVKVTGQNGKSDENVLPIAPSPGCVNAADPSPLWQAAGYRPALMASSFAAILQAYVAGFPHQALVLQTGPWAMPGISATGVATTPDYALTKSLVEQFATAAGAQAIVQNNGLEATAWSYASPVPDLPVALQEGAPITGDRSCRDNGGVTPCDPLTVLQAMLGKAAAAPFWEIYMPDLDNPAFAGALTAFNARGSSATAGASTGL